MRNYIFKTAAVCILTFFLSVFTACTDEDKNPSDAGFDYSPAFLDEYRELIGADEVKGIIDGHYPADYPEGKPYKIVEVQWGGTGAKSKYALGHIPGAIHLDTDELEAGVVTSFPKMIEADAAAKWKNTWNFFSYDRLIFLIENMGITKDTVVLVYSNSDTAACRFIIALFALGVDDVRLINGGYEAWTSMGYEGSTEISEYNVWVNNRNTALFNDAAGNIDYAKFDTSYDDPETTEDESKFDMTDPNQISPWKVSSGITTAAHPEYIVNAAVVNQARVNANSKIVSIRAYGEFFGLKSGYKYIKTIGEIDGAVWGYNSDVYMTEEKTLLDPKEVAEMWKGMGLTSDKEIIFYCGTGWRVSLTWFYAHILGYTNVKIYDGGWYEWAEFLHPVDSATYPIQ